MLVASIDRAPGSAFLVSRFHALQRHLFVSPSVGTALLIRFGQSFALWVTSPMFFLNLDVPISLLQALMLELDQQRNPVQ